MWLPPDEYKGFDGAIRLLHANKIPNNGKILYRDHLYRYTHDAETHEILCVEKIIIEGNQRIISGYMKEEEKYANKNRKRVK